MTERTTRILMAGDASVLVLFVLIGARSHREAFAPALVRNLVPLLACWFVVAWLLKTYSRPGIWRLALNWLIAIPIALLIRQAIVGRLLSGATPIFLAVAMAATLGLLAAWRLVAWIAMRAGGSGRAESSPQGVDA